ncbi:MAG TPA: hypothetical protein VHB73_03185 [Alphaproteobacteria bacterium]|nr:hypothetical protein [Alphaproteobacteria bacterium]
MGNPPVPDARRAEIRENNRRHEEAHRPAEDPHEKYLRITRDIARSSLQP